MNALEPVLTFALQAFALGIFFFVGLVLVIAAANALWVIISVLDELRERATDYLVDKLRRLKQ